MKIGSFGIMNNPKYRQEAWFESIAQRLICFDVVCLVCGHPDDPNMLAEAFPEDWKRGKLVAIYKPWPFPEWSYEELPKHLNTALKLARDNGCDWAMKLDMDTLIHEDDITLIRQLVSDAEHLNKWIISIKKLQFFKPTKYWVKDALPLIVKVDSPVVYGFAENKYTDLCQPVYWDGSSRAGFNGKYYDIPSGKTISKDKILKGKNIRVFNYDHTFRTYDRSIELLYQIEMAHARFWGYGYDKTPINQITRTSSMESFLQLSRERIKLMNKSKSIGDHPRVMQNIIKGINPEQWGYNMWGLAKPSNYISSILDLKIKVVLKYFIDIIFNFFSTESIVLIRETANWSIYEDCKNIKRHLKGTLQVRISTTPIGLRNKTIHFASVNTFIKRRGVVRYSRTNNIIITWFHLVEDDERKKYIPEINRLTSLVHTSCNLTKNRLIKFGLDPDKIVVIPLGVDLSKFHPASRETKKLLRDKHGVPINSLVIGSFQKDGNGWVNGETPKLIKGPDIFCGVVEELSKKENIFVVLTGPARGYVKNKLDNLGVSYIYSFLKDYKDLSEYYNLLDSYLISSREEGGPKMLLEAMASGVPVVSTKVGMVPDVIKNREDGVYVDVEDIEGLARGITEINVDEPFRLKIIKNGLEKVKSYSIENSIRQYYNKLYKNFI